MEDCCINNFDIIRGFLRYSNPDYFYFGQIIQRRKENPDIERNARIIKSYYIYSDEYLVDKMGEIIKLCDLFNARFYLNPNVRSLRTCTLEAISALLENVKSEQYTPLQKKIDSVCGSTKAPHALKYWILDIDDKSVKIDKLLEDIEKVQIKDFHFSLTLPTINGFHVIVKPFDVSRIELPDNVSIQKNNPTLIYYKNVLGRF